jgi:hypothetical protein
VTLAAALAVLGTVNLGGVLADTRPDARDSSAEYSPESACRQIRTALRALGVAEHSQAFALNLASEGGSTAIIQARLSELLERSADLRTALKRARTSKIARDPMVDQCIRMGFRALTTAEKLSSEVEGVLFGSDDTASNYRGPAMPELPKLPTK